MKLFLDDERQPHSIASSKNNVIYTNEPWKVVKNYDEFTNYIKNNEMPELISFDHDLCSEHYRYSFSENIPYGLLKEKTGYHCLVWLILYCNKNNIKLPKILIHTMNETAEKNMNNLLDIYSSLIIK